MICCAYCGQPATMRIPSNPEEVCFEHALEYWTELLAYARRHRAPCVEHESVCACQSCEELSASYLRGVAVGAATEELSATCRRTMAIAAAGPSPEEREGFAIRLAS